MVTTELITVKHCTLMGVSCPLFLQEKENPKNVCRGRVDETGEDHAPDAKERNENDH